MPFRLRILRCRRSAAMLLCACFLAAATGFASGEEPPTTWLTGEKLRLQLDQPVSINSSTRSGVPLRQALAKLSQSERVAILLDRRVDPDQKIEFTFGDASLDATLKLLASRLSIGVARVGSVMYFGPEATARRVRTLAALRHEEARSLPSAAWSQFMRLRSWKWDDLATPRDLLDELGRQRGVQIEGVEQIPHDLWAAADLPPMNFCDSLTLVAAEFDLTFSIDPSGQSVRLEPMPQTVAISHDYPLHAKTASADEIVAKLSKFLPDAQINFRGGTLSVRGRAEDQDFVQELLDGRTAKKTTVTKSEKRYTLTVVSKEVGKVIQTLGARLGLDVQFDNAKIDAAGLSLKTEVNVNVKNVKDEELLQAVLEPAGLTFDRNGNTITVRPKK